jgi:hypothetical protein|nr:MAG TPA: hypothetical protein [Caudoviricetes sp.]
MQFIKNDKLYDTDTAKLIETEYKYFYQPKPYVDKETHHSLYKKSNGEFFLIKEEYERIQGGLYPISKPTIEPLTEEEAKKWAEDNLSTTKYINTFGPISE